MRKGGVVLSLLIVGASLAGIRVFGTLQIGGAFIKVETEHDMACMRVMGIPGTEDLAIDRASGIVFVSSFDRRAELAHAGAPNDVRGGIYAYDLEDPAKGFVELTGIGADGMGPSDFRPHGLSLYTDPDGVKTLMVINHPQSGVHGVEVYDVIDGAEPGDFPRLAYRITVTSPSLVNPNDLVALDAVRFYATNDHGATHPKINALEDFLRLNMTSVVYYNGDMFSEALGGQTFANGIAVNGAGDEIYVAETTDGRVSAYRIEAKTGNLLLKREWKLKYGVDNIDIGAEGDLWVGGHPKLLDFVAHAQDKAVLSPGKVVRLDPTRRDDPVQVFQTNGEALSGLSVAAEHNGKIVMGQVFDEGLLVCE